MNFELTPAQQLFAVFYAIFFGVMLQTIGDRRTPKKFSTGKRNEVTLNLFDTPNAWAIGASLTNKPLFRAILSIIFLNLLPGIIFALIFLGLNGIKGFPNIWQITIMVWISLAPQYVYRLFYACLTVGWIRNILFLSGNQHKGYNDHDKDAVALLRTERDQFKAHGKFINHLAFPMAIYFPSVVILYHFFLVSWQLNFVFVYIIILWSLIWVSYFFIKNQG